jgi:hypothetical protein
MSKKISLYTWNNGEDALLFGALKNILGSTDNWKPSNPKYVPTMKFLAENMFNRTANDDGALRMRVAYLLSKQKASYYRTKGRIGVFNQVAIGAIKAGVRTYKDLAPRLNG